MDAFREGDDVYKVSVMVEVLARSAGDAVDFVDTALITDAAVNHPRMVSFSVATPGYVTREVIP